MDAEKMNGEEYVDVTVVEELKKTNGFDFWKIKINGTLRWVIKKYIKDLRPIICHRMKRYFDIPVLPSIRIKKNGRMYQLFMIMDPHEGHMMTLTKLLKKEKLTDDVRDQARKIHTFGEIFKIKTTNDSSILVKRENYRTVLYSMNNSPTENPGKNGFFIGNIIFNRWFNDCDISHHIKKSLLKFSSEKGTEDIPKISFAFEIFEEEMIKIVKNIDKNYVWYVSNIANEQIKFNM
jgi:hypothetical protein